jgi:hypothetical protein
MKVDRSTLFGNPFHLGDEHPTLGKLKTVDQVVEAYRLYLADWLAGKLQARDPKKKPEALDELKGMNLACWCELDQPCHRNVLLEVLNPKPQKKAQP